MAQEAHVLVEVRDGVGTITLNRPELLNAQSQEMIDGMIEATYGFERDPAVRCVVLRGAGRAFMAGADLNRLRTSLTERREQYLQQMEERVVRSHQIMYQLRRMEKPVIAAVHGAVAGIGCALMLSADLVVARSDAFMSIAYRHIGLTMDGGISYLLPRMIGERRALELALMGDRIDAPTAREYGLFNWVVPEAEFDARVGQLASGLAAGPTAALGRIKRLVRSSLETSWDQQLHREAESVAFAAGTRDHLEGITAFLEKRRPTFSGS